VPDTIQDRQRSAGDTAASNANRGVCTVKGARRRLGGIGRTKVYDLIAAGKLEAVKLGSRTLITAASIEVLLASLPRVAGRTPLRREGAGR
jgi:excisionase family DNA binding protein